MYFNIYFFVIHIQNIKKVLLLTVVVQYTNICQRETYIW